MNNTIIEKLEEVSTENYDDIDNTLDRVLDASIKKQIALIKARELETWMEILEAFDKNNGRIRVRKL